MALGLVPTYPRSQRSSRVLSIRRSGVVMTALYILVGTERQRKLRSDTLEGHMGEAGALEPWQWADDTWRGQVAHVRAGRSLKPASWPGGATVAVALSFDSDHE